eukprot:TRINITY_DN793_c0_g1_i1.p1 TRINITY_DN793_c0_g1~~TRINITY_DN793_c0_g1_i1.p1  ORF type:complete len:249 (-),score=20.29 TRINITY_DN793_c0_g1_i1:819-1535(-)
MNGNTHVVVLLLFLQSVALSQEDCAQKHPRCVFVAAVGLSGSTTLMDVLNQHPQVHIRGENNGLFNRFMNILNGVKWNQDFEGARKNWLEFPMKRTSMLTREEGYQGFAQFFKQFYAHDQDANKVVGFKEIRYWSIDQIQFIKNLCQDSKVIFQYTNETASIRNKMWYAHMKNAEQEIKYKTKLFLEFHQKNKDFTLATTVEDFKDPNFPKRLFDFLGLSLEGVDIDVQRVFRISRGG